MLNQLGYQNVTIGRHQFMVHPITGRVLPVVRGGADGDPDNPPPPQTFTQADVDRMVGQARKEARTSAANELAEQLGCSVEDAKAKIAAAIAADDAQKTEAQRALEAAQAEKAEAAAEKAAAAQERFDLRVERKLIAAGVGQAIADDADGTKAAAAIARARRLLDVSADATDADIAAEIEAVKADVPSLFSAPTEAPAPGRPAPTPPPKPNGTQPAGKTLAERGKETLLKAGIRPRDDAAA
jgi:colicin import membrane protein